ncbi:hypothetical protein CL633_01980 [bacterium]|nr:hypothetical protein [bacterium]|tara:strand:- start:8955 stop:9320 length:366 start_codon:yes stop_codon:yes gene_type:complete
MKVYWIIILLIFAFIIQITILPFLGIFNNYFNLLLFISLISVIIYPVKRFLFITWFSSLLLSLYSNIFFGVLIVFFILSSLVTYILYKKLFPQTNFIFIILSILAGLLSFEILNMLLQYAI